jgi:hypothetical protein
MEERQLLTDSQGTITKITITVVLNLRSEQILPTPTHAHMAHAIGPNSHFIDRQKRSSLPLLTFHSFLNCQLERFTLLLFLQKFFQQLPGLFNSVPVTDFSNSACG